MEGVLIERAQRPTQWTDCPRCGKRLHSKGFVPRQITSVIGTIRWKRCVGRCPHGCAMGQIAPMDNALGLLAHQRTSIELRLGCLLAVFVPFETVSVNYTFALFAVVVSLLLKKMSERSILGSQKTISL